jgi:hypothetical protein
MNDMLGNRIQVGDIVLYPGGNARYGGLKMIVGLVLRMTDKRMTLRTGPLVPDGKDFKTTSKTGAKILLTTDLAHTDSAVIKAMIALTAGT